MNAPTHALVETADSAIKRALSAIKGAVVPQQLRLNHPGLRKTFRHTYDVTDAHFYYGAVFCRATLPEEMVTPELSNIRDLLHNTIEELNKLDTQMQAIATSNGVQIGHSFNDQLIETQASTPFSKKYLDIFRKADGYLVLIDSLWIEGVIADDQHSKAGSSMCQLCHGVSNRVNDIFRRLLSESNRRRKSQEPQTAPAPNLTPA